MRTAHRFGFRIYFDNIMNHNGFDTPGFNEFVPEDFYPGFLPKDFHLREQPDGTYRKWDNTRDWGSEWQVQNLGLSGLIDIANEPGGTNRNHGFNEGDTTGKISFVRHPDNPEYYCYAPTAPGQRHAANEGTYVGFGPGNGITLASMQADPGFYTESGGRDASPHPALAPRSHQGRRLPARRGETRPGRLLRGDLRGRIATSRTTATLDRPSGSST